MFTISINPQWLTRTVRSLAVVAAGVGDERVYDAETARYVPNPGYVAPDASVRPILADALQDAGCDDADLLDGLRGAWRMGYWHDGASVVRRIAHQPIVELSQQYWGERTYRVRREAEAALEAADRALKAHADRVIAAQHYARVRPLIDRLESRSRAAYADRNVSRGYWLRQFASILCHPGYVSVAVHDLRGTPPAGTVWIRKSSSGKWGKSRHDKYGPPMTPAEVAAYVARQQEGSRVAAAN